MKKLQIRRGLKAGLPALLEGELAFAIDTKQLYVGTTDGNASTGATYFTTTIGTTDWTGTGPSSAVLTVNGILSTDRPLVDLDFTGVSFANVEGIQEAWGYVYDVEATATDEITFKATETPQVALNIIIKVVR